MVPATLRAGDTCGEERDGCQLVQSRRAAYDWRGFVLFLSPVEGIKQ